MDAARRHISFYIKFSLRDNCTSFDPNPMFFYLMLSIEVVVRRVNVQVHKRKKRTIKLALNIYSSFIRMDVFVCVLDVKERLYSM